MDTNFFGFDQLVTAFAAAGQIWPPRPKNRADASGLEIANDAGMDEAATAETMATFVVPSVEDQLSDGWVGAAAPVFMKGVADVFVASGSVDNALDSYAGTMCKPLIP